MVKPEIKALATREGGIYSPTPRASDFGPRWKNVPSIFAEEAEHAVFGRVEDPSYLLHGRAPVSIRVGDDLAV